MRFEDNAAPLPVPGGNVPARPFVPSSVEVGDVEGLTAGWTAGTEAMVASDIPDGGDGQEHDGEAARMRRWA